MTQIVAEAGRTRLSTRRQRRRIRFAVLLALLGGIAAVAVGVAAAAWLNGAWQWPTIESRSFREGGGGLFGLGAAAGHSPGALRFPVAIVWPPLDARVAGGIAVGVWVGWLLLVLRPVSNGLSRPTRHRGLARRRRIRSVLGATPARRAGRFTRPDLTRWQRFRLPTTAFGYRLLPPPPRRATERSGRTGSNGSGSSPAPGGARAPGCSSR